jgi:hypothetical protein
MLMRRLLSNTDATQVFAATPQKPEGKGEGQRVKRKLKQTEMFISDLEDNDCVDVAFEKCVTGVHCGTLIAPIAHDCVRICR